MSETATAVDWPAIAKHWGLTIKAADKEITDWYALTLVNLEGAFSYSQTDGKPSTMLVKAIKDADEHTQKGSNSDIIIRNNGGKPEALTGRSREALRMAISRMIGQAKGARTYAELAAISEIETARLIRKSPTDHEKLREFLENADKSRSNAEHWSKIMDALTDLYIII